MTDKGLKSNISKQLIQTSEKQITLLKNGQKNWTDTFQNGNAYDQWAWKDVNITNHQGNADQNHSEISPHTCQNGYYQKEHK